MEGKLLLRAPTGMPACVTWALAGNVALRAGQWLTLMLLAWAGGGRAVGDYGFASAICTPVVMLMGLQLSLVVSTTLSNEIPFATYLRLRTLMAVATPLVTVLLSLCLGKQADFVAVVFMLTVARSVDALADLMHGRIRREDRMDLVAQLQILRAVSSTAVFTYSYFITCSLFNSILVTAGVSLLILFIFDIPLARFVDPPVCNAEPVSGLTNTLALLKKALPLGASAMVISLYAYAPLFLIEKCEGRAAVGIVVAVASLPMAVETIVRSGLQATISRLTQFYSRGDEVSFWTLHRWTIQSVAILAILATGLTGFFGDEIVRQIFPSEFARYPYLLFFATAAASLGFLGNSTPSLLAVGNYGLYLRLWLGGLLVLIVACATLTPLLGVYGALYSQIIANAVRIAATYIWLGPSISVAFSRRTRLDTAASLAPTARHRVA